ncbi:MAG: response regulator [Chloroflexota bacterium]|nr:response regulator [Chloroflexota bacterium]
MLPPEPRELLVREIFSVELAARIPALNRALLRLERAESDVAVREAALGDLFRETHNLKAAARAVDHPGVEDAAHALESSVAGARRAGENAPTSAWFDDAYAAVDRLAGMRAPFNIRPDEPGEQLRPSPDAIEAPPMPEPVQARRAAAESVRVAVDKLDALLVQAGELAVTHLRVRQRQSELRALRDEADASRREWRNTRGLRAGLRRDGRSSRQLEAVLHLVEQAEQRSIVLLQGIEHLSVQLGRDTALLGVVTRAVEREVMAVRLLPIATVTTLLERTLRDLIRSTGKEVQLIIEGADTEIDRKILEQVRDPLMHLLRNAVDHGIEPPQVRVASGKPRIGTARVRAVLRGGSVEIEMSDDGGGLDVVQLRASAVRKGLFTEDQATAMEDPTIMDVIFQPGFSTRTTVTELSGRGVGLDVVRQHVQQLNGQVAVTSELGHGTRFTLRVPLTLATTRAILVEEAGQLLALPSTLIERSARVREQHIVTFEGCRAVTIEGRPVPVVELAALLERPPAAGREPDEWRPMVVLQQGERRLAILTDKLVGEQEIVVKNLGWPLGHVPNVSGAAVLGSGQTVVILNSSDLLKNGIKLARVVRSSGSAPAVALEHRVRRLLAVDDSLTTRTLMRSILESAGYDVVVAADGLEALTLLQGDSFDLVVADVEMPRMNGFELTEAIRRDERLGQTPVVLVTSLAGNDHRERGVAAGADAYIVKSVFEQGLLLDTVGRLL